MNDLEVLCGGHPGLGSSFLRIEMLICWLQRVLCLGHSCESAFRNAWFAFWHLWSRIALGVVNRLVFWFLNLIDGLLVSFEVIWVAYMLPWVSAWFLTRGSYPLSRSLSNPDLLCDLRLDPRWWCCLAFAGHWESSWMVGLIDKLADFKLLHLLMAVPVTSEMGVFYWIHHF